VEVLVAEVDVAQEEEEGFREEEEEEEEEDSAVMKALPLRLLVRVRLKFCFPVPRGI
jgi:hypothetical protein